MEGIQCAKEKREAQSEAQSEEQLRLIHQDLMDTGLVSMVL